MPNIDRMISFYCKLVEQELVLLRMRIEKLWLCTAVSAACVWPTPLFSLYIPSYVTLHISRFFVIHIYISTHTLWIIFIQSHIPYIHIYFPTHSLWFIFVYPQFLIIHLYIPHTFLIIHIYISHIPYYSYVCISHIPYNPYSCMSL